jgi:putative PIN family toxin of toxin-antitoxin system
MKLVLDTNVLIAALIARGVCADLLEHCVLSHTIVASDFILKELRAHLLGKFKYTDQEADEAIGLLESQVEVVTPKPLDQPVCRDPDDDQILATAVAAQAECIVTGDKDLLVLHRYEGIEIVSPSDFADLETKHNEHQS